MNPDRLTWEQLPTIPPSIDAPVLDFNWEHWESILNDRGVEIDRPRATPHPKHPSIIYPIDYGSLPGTVGGDGEPADVWSGTGSTGLTALIMTRDHVKQDQEVDLLWNCTPEEIYLVNGFVNFDRSLLQGRLILRRPMQELWMDFAKK
ncbi:MAG: hypothetical protein CMJ40_05745 [Phycisphaerae bacterium]|nr:hypothetical protein [Phycisphaerae bacterium]|tara:strand:- start:3909 stop:4352 length:444 start_codon:yes stop_codon:yes gene_type:complete